MLKRYYRVQGIMLCFVVFTVLECEWLREWSNASRFQSPSDLEAAVLPELVSIVLMLTGTHSSWCSHFPFTR
jgi:hypothetical protein